MKKIIFIILLILCTGVVSATGMTITVLNPVRVIRNLTVEDVGTGYVSVRNDNNFNITVSVGSPFFEFSKHEKKISPAQESKFYYSFKVEDTGSYIKTISVMFSTEEENVSIKKSAFSATVKFMNVSYLDSVEEEVSLGENGNETNKYIMVVICVFFILIIFLVTYVKKREKEETNKKLKSSVKM